MLCQKHDLRKKAQYSRLLIINRVMSVSGGQGKDMNNWKIVTT